MNNLYDIANLENKISFKQLKKLYSKYLNENPNSSEAYNKLGVLIFKYEKNSKLALEHFTKAIELNHQYVEALNNRAAIYTFINNLELALLDLDMSIIIDENNSISYNNRGVIKRKQKKINDSIDDFSKALIINPKFEDCLYNRGTAFLNLLRLDDALNDLSNLISINKNYANAYLALGNTYRKLNNLTKAMFYYEEAMKFPLTQDVANLNKATLLLLNGNYEQGLILYELRFKTILKKYYDSNSFEKLWDGKKNLNNKTILIRCEQGLGDTIQFSRYLENFKIYNCKVIFEVQKNLMNLLVNTAGADIVKEIYTYKGNFDYFCPLMSLPKIFNTNINNIPIRKSYINLGSTNTFDKWDKIIGTKKKPRVGLCWSCNPKAFEANYKSINLLEFGSKLSNKIEWISLQKEYQNDDANLINQFKINDLSHHQEDFLDTAKLILKTDLVITIDTSIAHCAGALGKKTILLLPPVPDWRWMRKGNTSPWYSELHLVRRKFEDKWGDAFIEAQKIAEKYLNFK